MSRLSLVGRLPALLHADEWVSLTEGQGIAVFAGDAMVWQGWCLTMLGQPEKGMTQLMHGLAASRAQGPALLPMNLALLADAQGKVKQPQHGLMHVDEAINLIDETGAGMYEAEAHRVKGEPLLSIQDNDRAVASFRKAIEVAQRQSAKLFELRASTSLARLWRDQGKRKEARELLAPVYGWFTEGLDTLDLKEAKALLDKLAS
jgi:predicted ATPase